MGIPVTQKIFPAVEAGDLDSIPRLLDDDPGLVHVHATPEVRPWTPLQSAAAKGQLGACRILVDRGPEVYTNPMSTYPPIMLAAWNKHAEVVAYFLEEIPHKAAGTNGLGVAINLAARQGWVEIVRKHIERDPLSVHQRGWIGDSPLHWPSHNNHPETVSMRLDAGAHIEADEINCYGGKPLHWANAQQSGLPRIQEVIVKCGFACRVNSCGIGTRTKEQLRYLRTIALLRGVHDSGASSGRTANPASGCGCSRPLPVPTVLGRLPVHARCFGGTAVRNRPLQWTREAQRVRGIWRVSWRPAGMESKAMTCSQTVFAIASSLFLAE